MNKENIMIVIKRKEEGGESRKERWIRKGKGNL